ncbi:MAG: hypothetical protein GQ477_02735 [Nanohaloarchaea archaeon]|nr:hypothetical protein [Candidatus Nanohaloarchaea archaeon]
MTCFGLNPFGTVGGEVLVDLEPYPTTEEHAGINPLLFEELYLLQHNNLTRDIKSQSCEIIEDAPISFDPKIYFTLKIPQSVLISAIPENTLPHEVLMIPAQLYKEYIQEVGTISDVQKITMRLPTNPALLRYWGIN